jgi:photosynthetic reaction center H subunit
MIGAFTQQIDLAQILVLAFVGFFFGLDYYIRREDKREGYPLEEAIPTLGHGIVGFPEMPAPKTYKLLEGGTVTLPQEYERRELKAYPREFFPGAPLYPLGEPLLAGIGPGSYALRRDEPFVMIDGSPQLEPLRKATDYTCVDPDLDPRGRRIFGADMKDAGVAVDVWIDKGSKILRYVEVALDGVAERRLVPIFYANVPRDASYFKIDCVTAAQLALAPVLRHPDSVTAREEDRINGFYAGGHMYSIPLKEALL